MLEFWVALIVFMASHSVIARSGLRGLIVQKWGEKTYLTLYSLLSLILLAWLILAAQNAPRTQLWPWLYELYWIPNIFMPLACIFLVSGFVVPNPLSIAANRKEFDPERPGFIVALTRHPILWGFFLWSASHVIPNGEYPLIVMFGVFAGFSLVGLKIVDRKRKRELGMEQWDILAKNTHAVLFASRSLWAGRFQFTRYDITGILSGLFVYFLLYSLHETLFGINPMPPM